MYIVQSLPPISYALIENEMSFEVQISYKIIDNCNCFVPKKANMKF